MSPAPYLTDNRTTPMHLLFEHVAAFVGLMSTTGIVLEANPSAL